MLAANATGASATTRKPKNSRQDAKNAKENENRIGKEVTRRVITQCGSGNDLVVFGMRADPYPIHSPFYLDGKRPVVCPHAHRPHFSDLLEVERRMAGIRLENFVILVRELPHICGKRAIEHPELRRSEMLQISRALPAL